MPRVAGSVRQNRRIKTGATRIAAGIVGKISLRRVNEQLSRGQDVILVPVDVLVCHNCGERYYDRRTMQKLEEIEDAVNAGHVSLERVGEVMRVRPELVPA